MAKIQLAFLLSVLLTTVVSFAAQESPQSFTYQGRLLNSAGTAGLASIVDFKLQIYGGPIASECLLYEETQSSIDLTATQGAFSLKIGNGSRSGSDPGLIFADVFKNNGAAVTPVTCVGGATSYTANAGDSRRMRVNVFYSGAWTTLSPDQTISSVPQTLVAETLQGYGPTGFIMTASSGAANTTGVTQANIQKLVNGSVDVSGLAGFHNHDARYLQSSSAFSGDVTGSASATVVSKLQTYTLDLTTAPTNGQVLTYVTPANKWVASSLPASGLQTLNGISAGVQPSQSLAVTNAAGALAWTSAGSTHTLNIPTASGTTNGLLASGDYTTFSNKVGGSGTGGTVPKWSGAGASSTLTDSLVSENGTTVSVNGTLDMTNSATHRIINLEDPSGAQDAVTKGWASATFAASGSLANYLRADGTTVLTGNWATGGFDITGTGNLTQASSKYFGIGTFAGNPSTVGWGVAEKGRMWYDTTANTLKYWDGGAVQTVGNASASGVSSFNSRTGAVMPVAGDYTWAQIDKTTSSIADLATRSASDLNSGTLNDALLSANVAMRNASNTFSKGNQQVNNDVNTNPVLVLKGAANQNTGVDYVQVKDSTNALVYGLNKTGTPTAGTDLTTKSYVDSTIVSIGGSNFLKQDGSTSLTANWATGGFDITGVGNFSTAAGKNATFDANTLYVDGTNHRVGIGTSTPGYKLDVVVPFNVLGVRIGQVGDSNGFGDFGSNAITVWANGTTAALIGQGGGSGYAGVRIASDGTFGWSSTLAATGAKDLMISRDAANTLAQSNGTNAQQYNLYNTYTDATHFERAELNWISNANVFTIQTTAGSGGGTVRNMALMGGNVGVGTITPSRTVDVVGTLRAAPGAYSNFDFSDDPTIKGHHHTYLYNQNGQGGGGIFIDPSSELPGGYGDVVFKNAGTELMRITPAGTVGIGSTTPGATLDVKPATNTATSGTIIGTKIQPTYNQASGTAANTDLLINRTETAIGSGQQNLIDAQVAGVSKFRVDNTGKIYGDGSQLSNIPGVISGLTPGKVPKATSSTTLSDSLISDDGTTVTDAGNLTVAAGKNATFDANTLYVDGTNHRVGIGTTGPLSPMHVYSNGTALRVQSSSATNYEMAQIYNGTANAYVGVESSTGGTAFTGTTGYAAFLINGANKDLQLGTNGAVNMTIQAGGNVGIGTTAPASALQIGSGVLTVPAGSVAAPSITFSGGGTNTGFYNDGAGNRIDFANGGTNTVNITNNAFQLHKSMELSWDSAGAPSNESPDIGLSRGAAGKLYVGNGTLGDYSGTLIAGNVGINATSPGSKLEVDSATTTSKGVILKSTDDNTTKNIFETQSSTGAVKTSIRADGVPTATTDLTTKSYVDATVVSIGGSNFLKQDGSTPLTANWATGGFDITGTGNFSTAAGKNATFDTNTLYVDGVNHRVGIGTTGPAAPLHVLGSTEALRLQRAATGAAAVRMTLYGGGTDGLFNWQISKDMITNNNLEFTPSTAANGSTFSTPALVMTKDGNVGIGTTTPARTLHTVGPVDTVSTRLTTPTTATNSPITPLELEIKSTGTMADGFGPRINFYNSDSGSSMQGLGSIGIVRAGANTTGDVVFRPSAAGTENERMRITSAGNVGIGTTSPATPLQVNGSVASKSIIESSWTSANTALNSDYGGVALYNSNTTNNNYSSLYFTTNDTNGAQRYPASIQAVYTSHSPATPSADLVFSTGTQDSPPEKMRILANGNVGIGTTSPQQLLQVNGAIRTVGGYGATNASASIEMGGAGTSPNAGSISWGDNSGWKLNFGTSVAGTFTPRVTMVDTGNVGIGSTNPGYKLDVSGTVNATAFRGPMTSNSISGTYGTITLDASVANYTASSVMMQAAAAKPYLAAKTGTSDSASAFNITNSSDTSLLYIRSDGNIGIGTATPGYKLDILTTGTLGQRISTTNSTVALPQIDIIDSGRSSETVISSTDGTTVGTYIASYSNHPLMFGSNAAGGSTAKMVLLANGNVGIGTTSTGGDSVAVYRTTADGANILSIDGAAGATGYRINAKNNGTSVFRVGPTGYTSIQDSTTNTALSVTQTGTGYAATFAGGNVGIGTTSPGYVLQVTGTSADAYLGMIDNTSTTGITRFGIRNASAQGMVEMDIMGGASPYGVIQTGKSTNIPLYYYASTHAFMTGNVGIGMTSPKSILDLGTSYSLTMSSNDGNGGFDAGLFHNAYMYNNAGVVGYKWVTTHAGFGSRGIQFGYNSATSDGIKFFADQAASTADTAYTPTQRMIIANNGDVGIGMATPAARLHVVAGAASQNAGAFYNNNASYAALLVGNSGGAGSYGIYDSQSARHYFSGSVGIGTNTPSYQLQLSTDSAAKPGTALWTIASDSRLKDIRAPFTRGLAALEQINPIYYTYKKDNPENLPSDKEYVGIIAQDAEKAVPEAVSKDEKGYLHVTSDSIIWAMLNGVKELYHKFLSHEASLSSLQQENSQLKSENSAIKAYLCGKDPNAAFCK